MAKKNTTKGNNKKSKKVYVGSNAGKVNWGVLRDAEHKAVMASIAGWKDIRSQMAIDQINRKAEIEDLRNEDAYKGHLIDGEWIVTDKGAQHNANAVDFQTEYNTKEEAILIRYKELTKERRSAMNELYKSIGLDKHLFESYSQYMTVDSGEQERTAYLTEMEAFLKLGLKVPFGDSGLKYAAYELVKGIGKRMNGVGASYRKDVDAEAYKKSAFQDAVMANLRSILQEKGVIAINPIENENKNQKSNKKSAKKNDAETVADIAATADLKIENENRVTEPVQIADPAPKSEAKIKSRNRGVAKKLTPVKEVEKQIVQTEDAELIFV